MGPFELDATRSTSVPVAGSRTDGNESWRSAKRGEIHEQLKDKQFFTEDSAV